MKRIKNKFSELKKHNHCGFIAYLCAGDPDFATSLTVLNNLANNGVDLIEIGVPFLDPSGDGPIIENASKRSINRGMNLKKVLELSREFRKNNHHTPLIMMTYFNPLLKYGLENIFQDVEQAGFDGILIVDLPFEEEQEVVSKIKKTNLDFIRLIAPSTPLARMKKIIKNASGFLYLISMLGITGTKLAQSHDNIENLKNLRSCSKLPIAIGFGIQNPNQAQEFSQLGCNAVVVGSAIVKVMNQEIPNDQIISETLKIVKDFAGKIKS